MKKSGILFAVCLMMLAQVGCAKADTESETWDILKPSAQVAEKTADAEEEMEPIEEEAEALPDLPEEKIEEQPIEEEPKEQLPEEEEKPKEVFRVAPAGEQYDLSTLTYREDVVTRITCFIDGVDGFEELLSKLDPAWTVVFRGVVNGKSTQCKDENDYYNETPVLVQEVYYGNLTAGEVVYCYEDMKVYYMDDKPFIEHYGYGDPLDPKEEYLFILREMKKTRQDGSPIYRPYDSRHPNIRIGQLEQLQNKAELNHIEKRNLDALNYFYLGMREQAE